jgi:hypothetical protein
MQLRLKSIAASWFLIRAAAQIHGNHGNQRILIDACCQFSMAYPQFSVSTWKPTPNFLSLMEVEQK